MKMQKLLCSVALLGLLAGSAQAADLLYPNPAPVAPVYTSNSGLYVGVEGGYNAADDLTGFINPPANTAGGTANLDGGFTIGAKLGYQFNPWGALRPRVELEGGYLENTIDKIQAFNAGGPVGTPFQGGGNFNAFYGLLNGYLDYRLWNNFSIFGGGGVGFASEHAANVSAGGVNIIDDRDTGFAWDLTAGVSYELSPTVTFDLAYRFLRFQDVSFAGNFAGGTLPAVGQDVDNNQVTAGIRIKLN